MAESFLLLFCGQRLPALLADTHAHAAFNLVAHAGEREAGHFPELAHVVDVQDPLYIFSGDNLDGWE